MIKSIGELNQQVQLATKVVEIDPDYGGEENISWQKGNSIWAKVEFLQSGSSEAVSSNQKTNRTAVNFTLRFREVSTTQDVVYKGLRYEIVSVLPDVDRCYVLLETLQIGEYNNG